MKELVITPPDGYEIDKENSTLERIVFKEVKKNKYPTNLNEVGDWCFLSQTAYPKARFSSPERLQEVLALIQLLAFRDAVWEIDGWKPEFDIGGVRYSITNIYGVLQKHNHNFIDTVNVISDSYILRFKSAETRDWFLETHRELIEQAKNLL